MDECHSDGVTLCMSLSYLEWPFPVKIMDVSHDALNFMFLFVLILLLNLEKCHFIQELVS